MRPLPRLCPPFRDPGCESVGGTDGGPGVSFWQAVDWSSGLHVVEVFVLHHAGVDPSSPHSPGSFFSSREGDEGIVTRSEEAAELLVLVARVEGRELDEIHEGLVADIFQGVQQDLVMGPGRPDLDVSDAKTLR